MKKLLWIACAIIIVSIQSCSTQKIVYLRDVPDQVGITTTIVPAEFVESVIQNDDILNITIQTIDPAASAALNQTAASMPSAQGSVSGYLIDKMGNVEIPMLGIIKLSGLTTSEAREKVRMAAARYYKNPTVQVRFANYKFTMIGDVNRSGTFVIPNEKFSILDALGMAGDLQVSGKRNNVMLIRDNNGKKDIVRLDLTSTDLLKSPYFYLKQNDVIYIEPGSSKVAANNAASLRYVTLGISLISFALSIYFRSR